MRQCVDVKRGTSVRCSLGVWGDIGGLRRWLRLTTRNKQRQQRQAPEFVPKEKTPRCREQQRGTGFGSRLLGWAAGPLRRVCP